jgi:hypothetical protein
MGYFTESGAFRFRTEVGIGRRVLNFAEKIFDRYNSWDRTEDIDKFIKKIINTHVRLKKR